MAYSKLGNIKGPQGRRGLNMTGGTTTPPTVDDSVLEGDLWLDSVTGDVYRATDPWGKDGSWNEWGTVLWKVDDNTLMVQPAEGDTGTFGEPVMLGPYSGAPWCNSSVNPSRESMTSVRSKGTLMVNENNGPLFYHCSSLTNISAVSEWDISNTTYMEAMFSDCTSLTDISPLASWDVSNVTDMGYMFAFCPSLSNFSSLSGWDVSNVTVMRQMFNSCPLTDLSPLSNWDVSGVTDMGGMFYKCPFERIGIPSLAHGGKNFVSRFKDAEVVTDLDTVMLTNTTTHETMSANQMLADMDTNPSKYATGTIWTL